VSLSTFSWVQNYTSYVTRSIYSTWGKWITTHACWISTLHCQYTRSYDEPFTLGLHYRQFIKDGRCTRVPTMSHLLSVYITDNLSKTGDVCSSLWESSPRQVTWWRILRVKSLRSRQIGRLLACCSPSANTTTEKLHSRLPLQSYPWALIRLIHGIQFSPHPRLRHHTERYFFVQCHHMSLLTSWSSLLGMAAV